MMVKTRGAVVGQGTVVVGQGTVVVSQGVVVGQGTVTPQNQGKPNLYSPSFSKKGMGVGFVSKVSPQISANK